MSSNLRIKRICAWCGKEFIAQKTTTACCSKQCANALYKKRKRDEAIKANNQIVEKKIEEKPIERIKDKPFLTITETAIYLGVTRPTVYGYIKRSELKVIRLGFKYLLNKEDIDALFNNPTEFHTPTKEKAPITDFYTTAEIKEKFNVAESWIFAVAKKNNIPRTFNRGKTYWSKKHMDSVMEIGEHILFLCEGKAEWEGTKDEIVSSDNEKLNSFIFASDLFRKVKDVELDQQEK